MSQPNPGSDEARKLGCKCPVLDNGHGAGFPAGEGGATTWWINVDCRLHADEREEEDPAFSV